MKLLIIGGTAFVGRAIAEYALSQGHEVSLFHRGKTNADILPEAEHLLGDRTEDMSALNGRKWDAVIDTCGYVPRVVEMSAQKLQDVADHYTFISTISVYADLETNPNFDEEAPLATLEDETTEEITGETYGGLKVLCENVVRDYFPDSYTIVRPGLIVGPHDYTHRFAYWILRMAEGGEMLAPGNPQQPMQVIDARDLAKFTVDLTTQKVADTFHATGCGTALTDILDIAREVTGTDTKLTWIEDEAFLLENEIQPWMSLPLWVPAEAIGIHTANVDKAVDAGLKFRSMQDTIQDSYEWLQATAQQSDARSQVAHGALARDKEAEILTAWHQRN